MNIPRYVYVNPTIFLLIFFSWVIGRMQELLLLIAVVSIHELSHILAAKLCGMKVEKALLTPLGMAARINYTSSKNNIHEIIVHSAGPFSNIIMAGTGYLVNSYFLDNSENVSFFVLANFSILFLNILPVLPLDGGRIFKSILLCSFGYKRTLSIFFILSRIISITLMIAGIYQLFNCWYNASLLFIGIFIYTWMYKEKEEMQFALIREWVLKSRDAVDNENYKKVYIQCDWQKKSIEVIGEFRRNKYNIVRLMDADKNEMGEITETELLESLVEEGLDLTLEKSLIYSMVKRNLSL
jgi:stage IV sporulation protein FB